MRRAVAALVLVAAASTAAAAAGACPFAPVARHLAEKDGGIVPMPVAPAFVQVMQCAPGSFVSFPAPVPPPAGADDGVPVATPAPRARLSDLTATVEMTVAPAYNVPFRGRDGAWWRPGSSRLNASTTMLPPDGGRTPAIVAALHTVPCAGAAARGGAPAAAAYGRDAAYRRVTGDAAPAGGAAGAAGAMVAASLAAPAGVAAPGTAAASLAGTAVAPFLVDYDEAVSVVAYDGSTPVACCQLAPPAPRLPDEWGATVEANIVEKGYTLTLRQVYSAPLGRVRTEVHAGGVDRVVFQDLNARSVTLVDAPNATHPGACATRAASPDEGGVLGLTGGGGKDGAILSTADALRFTPGDVAHAPLARALVRGVPAETWIRTVDDPVNNATYTASYLFPVNAWMAGGENYHRMLRAIIVNGTRPVVDPATGGPDASGAREALYHEYHFVSLRPRPGLTTGAGGPFDPCMVAPRGVGCACGKGGGGGGTDADAVPYAGASAGRAPARTAAADDDARAALAAPRGFVPSQAGPYTLIATLCTIGGVLLAVGVPAAVRAAGGERRRAFEPFQGAATAPTPTTVHAMSVASA